MTENIIIEDGQNGEIHDVQIAPVGDFTGSAVDGSPVEEKLDISSLQRLADKLNSSGEEVLCDVDHASARAGVEKDTSSAGWFSKFIVDPMKGLIGKLKLTKRGRELVENREYRFLSPAFELDEDGKPVNMMSVSLTNMPAFKGRISPVLNTEPMETIAMEMTKEDLVNLIKETVTAMNACGGSEEKTEEVKNEEPKAEEPVEEKTETAETAEVKTEEVKNEETVEETVEEKIEDKAEEAEEKKEEKEEKAEEKKEEVIKMEALNSQPNLTIKPKSGWENLHGEEFFKWLAAHPDVKE